MDLKCTEVIGVVSSYDANRGFGYLSVNKYGWVLLHVTCLRASGYKTAHVGMWLRCEIIERWNKCPQAFRVLGEL